ncbi:MAG: ATP-binding protein [Bacteroidota bacterium]
MYNSLNLSIFRIALFSLLIGTAACSTENGEAGNLNIENDSLAHPILNFYDLRSDDLAYSRLDSSISYAEKGLKYSQENNLRSAEAHWLLRLGSYYRVGGLNSIAENYLAQSMEKYQMLDEPLGLAAVYEERGFNFLELGEAEKALEFSSEALKRYEALSVTDERIDIHLDLGEYFLWRNKLKLAWEEYQRSTELLASIQADKGDKEYKEKILGQELRSEELKANITLAEGRFEEAISILKKLNQPEGFTNIGHTLRVRGDQIGRQDSASANSLYRESEKYHRQSFDYHHKIAKYPRLILDYWNLGGIERRLGNYQASIDSLWLGIKLAYEKKIVGDLAGMYKTLSETYQYKGQKDSALKYFKRHKFVSDSLKLRQDETATRVSEVHYETERKELEKIQAEKESEIKSRQLSVSILLSLLFAGMGVFYFYRSKARKKLMEKQTEINSQLVVDLIQEQTIENLNARIEGQEEERERIARELHDQLGGTLAAVKFSLEGMEKIIPQELKDAYQKTHKLLQTATDNTRSLSHQMKALPLESLGLAESLGELCDTLNASGKLSVHFNTTSIFPSNINQKSELHLYRICQELFQNIIKHAQAEEVFLQLTYEADKLTLMMEDDGIGFEVEREKNGMGMQNIADRVAQIKGKLDFDSKIGQGTTVIIEVPTEAN